MFGSRFSTGKSDIYLASSYGLLGCSDEDGLELAVDDFHLSLDFMRDIIRVRRINCFLLSQWRIEKSQLGGKSGCVRREILSYSPPRVFVCMFPDVCWLCLLHSANIFKMIVVSSEWPWLTASWLKFCVWIDRIRIHTGLGNYSWHYKIRNLLLYPVLSKLFKRW